MTTAERQDYAAKLKREMNCCQAVVRAFADTVSLDEATLTSLAAGFGSGMGTMEGSCGALVGAVMVAGLRTGGSGTMAICRELKGVDTGKPLCSCEDCVRNAVLAAAEALG